ncbi:MAG: hypothetical protein AB7E29_08400 [Xanthobacter sp.]
MEDENASFWDMVSPVYSEAEEEAIKACLSRLTGYDIPLPCTDDEVCIWEFFRAEVASLFHFADFYKISSKDKSRLPRELSQALMDVRNAARLLVNFLGEVSGNTLNTRQSPARMWLEGTGIGFPSVNGVQELLHKIESACDQEIEQMSPRCVRPADKRSHNASKPILRLLEQAVAHCWIAHGGEINYGEEYEAFYMLCVSPIDKRPELGRAHNIALTESSFSNHVKYLHKGIYRYLA